MTDHTDTEIDYVSRYVRGRDFEERVPWEAIIADMQANEHES